jgi:crotonobetainyl-CoA:carnitine CoA-transferase CaiB-like acyl-CoA transferase
MPDPARQADARGILGGVRIVELCQGLAGPVAVRFLADAGADVVKVEPAPDGDRTRWLEPAAYATWNRGKRSVLVDLDGAGPQVRALIADADVIVHDFPQSVAARHGLDDHTLTATLPRAVVASVTGYPVGHPDADLPGREILVQARLGAMDEQQALRPGPMFIRMPFANWIAAYLLAGGIVARLLDRLDTGRGSAVHTSLLQGALLPASLYWHRAENPPPWMVRHALRRDDHPSNLTVFRCADGRWLHVLGGFSESPPICDALAEMGLEHLAGGGVTVANRAEWARMFATRALEGWTSVLWPLGVICMPVLELGEVFGVEQARLNGYCADVQDERFGATVQAGFPFQVEPPLLVRGGAPWTPERSADGAVPAWGEPPPTRGGPARAGRPGLRAVRVLDFGSYVAGPMGAQCLADLGADVIKVEPPWGERGRTINQFTGCQRGKRSLAIDLRRPEAAEILRRLLSSADVVTHNIREKAARKLGVDAASVRAANPATVFAHCASYGAVGPWAEFGAFDPAACALSGWEQNISGPGNTPTWLRNSSMDTSSGLALFVAVTLALYRRRCTGDGSAVRTSLLGVGAMTASETLVRDDGSLAPFLAVDRNQTGISPYYRIYQAADDWVAVAALTEDERKGLQRALGVADPVGFEAAARMHDAAVLLAVLAGEGVPAERVAVDNRDPFFDRELGLSSGLIMHSPRTPYGWFENPGGYWTGPDGAIASDLPIPFVGEHTVEILDELGFTREEIAGFIDEGLVSDHEIDPPPDYTANRIVRSLAHDS